MEEKDITITNLQKEVQDLKDKISKINEDATGCVYLLQESKFLKKKDRTYKLCFTTRELLTRITKYPKGSIMVYSSFVPNLKDVETNLLKLFNEKFVHKPEYGTEYFNGNPFEMIQTIAGEILV
jgi:hypothetical protein